MQTFLPYPNLGQSVRCLDYRRLGKQRVEALQILNALSGKTKGWASHPAAKMWRNHTGALALYQNLCIDEWVRRGYKNNMAKTSPSIVTMPDWFGDEAFHASHRSNLLRKDPVHYGEFGWDEPDDLAYVWPVP